MFNPLDHPICFAYPLRIADSAWLQHTPFGLFSIEILRPRIVVELGTHSGVSYCSFCQAVRQLGTETTCYAIDTWRGDEQSRYYGDEVLDELRAHHDPLYGGFSHLVRSTFDDQLAHFTDGTIDLLHVDGHHTYESVKHDFETWLPKLSTRGVILLHDVNVRERDFGVWRLWEELRQRYAGFAFLHGHGLGVLIVGEHPPESLHEWLETATSRTIEVRDLFAQLGQRVQLHFEREHAAREASRHLTENVSLQTRLDNVLTEHEAERVAIREHMDAQVARREMVEERLAAAEAGRVAAEKRLVDAASREAELATQLAERQGQLDQQQHNNAQLQRTVAAMQGEHASEQARAERLAIELANWQQRAAVAEATLDALRHTRSMRIVQGWWRAKAAVGDRVDLRSHRSYFLARTATQILREEGSAAFADRLGRWIGGERRFYTKEPAQIAGTDLTARYDHWIEQHEPDSAELQQQRNRAAGLHYRPLISIVMAVYNPPVQVLRDAVLSVLTQTYDHLQLCIANGGQDPSCRALLTELQERDERIRLVHLDTNGGISANSNVALSMVEGEFVALMDHDDLLAPFALFAVVEQLNTQPDLDILYSDEDRITTEGKRVAPFMKPDWSPELLHSFMYVGHLTVYRAALVVELGDFREKYDGSQDYDLILRASEVTDKIGHIPQVLYHWRMLPESAASDSGAKEYARATNIAALGDAMTRRGYSGKAQAYPYSNRFKFDLRERPLISIIIPTDSLENLVACLAGLYRATTYPHYEVIIVTNTTVATAIERRFSLPTLHCVRFDEKFNFSLKCNTGAEQARGAYLVFLNDDVEPLTADWLETLLEYAQQPDIGGVSPKLLYTNDTIQYAGMVTGVRDLVGTAFHTCSRHESSYSNMAISVRDVSVLSGACVMLRATEFRRVGGWDAVHAPIANSDLDLSFRLREQGLRLIYTPFAELRHIGHQSIGDSQVEQVARGTRLADRSHLYMLERWGDYISYDPYYTPNMRDILWPDPGYYGIFARSNAREGAGESTSSVLLISHDLTLSGAPIILLEIARYLWATGLFVVVMAPGKGPLLAQYQTAGIPVLIDPRILMQPFDSLHLFGAFDLIVPNTVLGWECVHAAKSIHKPCVWLVHESEFGVDYIRYQSRHAAAAFGLANAVVFPAQLTTHLYAQYAQANPHITIHYGIGDVAAQSLPPAPFRPDPTRLRVIHVGSLEYRKGADVLIEALGSLPREIAERLDVYLVGRLHDPDYVTRIRAMTGGMANVQLVGETPRAQVLSYMRHTDVFVCTSREETGPIVVIEAMAMGKAIISTRVGAAGEIIRTGENGVLIDVDDSAGLADAFAEFVAHRDRLARLGQAARATYEQELTIERYGRDMIAIFTAAISGRVIGRPQTASSEILVAEHATSSRG